MPASLDTETLPIGDRLCVFRRDTHALCLLNGTAAEIWQAKARGLTDEMIAQQLCDDYGIGHGDARADVAGLTADWRATGLTAAPSYSSSCQCNEPPDRHDAAPTPGDQTCYLDALYGAGSGGGILDASQTPRDPPLQLQCHDRVLAGLLAAVLKPLRCDALLPGAGAAIPDLIEVGADGGADEDSYWIKLPGANIARNLPRAVARRWVLRQLLLQRHGRTNTAAILHASAVEIGGKAVLIAGRSGAGKTTLTAALVRSGAGYLADDLVALTAKGGHAGDFPARLAIKEGSWPLVATLFPRLADCETLTTRRLKVRYLDVAGELECQTPRQREIAAIVLPRFDAGSDLIAERLSPETTFAALLDSGSEPQGPRPSMAPLARLANGTKAWRLHYSHLDHAVARIIQLGQAA